MNSISALTHQQQQALVQPEQALIQPEQALVQPEQALVQQPMSTSRQPQELKQLELETIRASLVEILSEVHSYVNRYTDNYVSFGTYVRNDNNRIQANGNGFGREKLFYRFINDGDYALVYIYRPYTDNVGIIRQDLSGVGQIYLSHIADLNWVNKPSDILTFPLGHVVPGVIITTFSFYNVKELNTAQDILEIIDTKKKKYEIPKSFNNVQQSAIKDYIIDSNTKHAMKYATGTQLIT